MSEALVLAGLWTLFGGSHMALSSIRLRPRLVASLGEAVFQGLYSLLALAVFGALVWFYFAHKHAGPLLWALPVGDLLRWTLYLGNGVAVVLVVAGLITPSPAMPGVGSGKPRGVQHLTRHGLFMGVGLWGLLHLLVNGYAGDVAFFAGFPLFGLLGCWHQDQRKLATQPDFRAFWERTPFLPFSGPNTIRGLRELSPLALVLGVALTIALRWFHGSLFGP